MTKSRPIRISGSSLQTTLDRLCKRHRVCGASLAVLKDGEIHVAASGFANAPERIAVTPTTLFQVGSISKTFTATLAMQLVEEGLLDLDAPVRRYLPRFATADPRTSRVTVRQLLTHTSGMEGDFFPADDSTSASYVHRMLDLGQLHAPGEYMTYCNSGYVILTTIIEELRGTNWSDLVMARICKPLGLSHAMAHLKEALRFRMANGHVLDKSGEWTSAPTTYFPLSMAGAGTILSMSATDLLRYAEAHMAGSHRRASKSSILSRESFRAMQTPQVEMPRLSRNIHTHMGLSWFLDPDIASPKINHDGGTSQLAFLHMLPKQHVAYVLFINNISTTMGEAVREAIFTEVAGLPPQRRPQVPRAIAFDPARYIGSYASLYQDHEVTLAKPGHLHVEVRSSGEPKASKLLLRAVAADEFAILDKPQVTLGSRVLFLGEHEGRAKYCRFGVRMSLRSDNQRHKSPKRRSPSRKTLS